MAAGVPVQLIKIRSVAAGVNPSNTNGPVGIVTRIVWSASYVNDNPDNVV